MGNIRDTLERSEKMICKGIDEINEKGDLNASNLELLGEAVDALKDIYTIKEKADTMSYERSMPYYMNDGYGARDSRGRFMNDGYRGYDHEYMRGYNRYGADDDKDYIKWKMQNAPTEQEREMYRRRMEQM